ncbi:MAG: hypothetical protein ACR2P1_26990 [Pseudomonadales bacterium]
MKKLLLTIVCLSVVSCAATQNQPVNPETLATLKGKSLTLIQRESPTFVAMTSGKGMFAVAGVGAAAAAGNKLVKDNEIADPAMDISSSLAQALTTRHGLKLQGQSAGVTASNDMHDIVKLADGSEYALDVVTNGWSYIYDGFKFSDYFVGYSAKLRLIEVNTSKVISGGFCAYDAKKAGKSPVVHEKLLENNAAYIKQEISDAADFCTQQFIAELF